MFHSRDLADRQVLAAVREHQALGRKRFTIIKLEEPIQRGWRRFYVLSKRSLAHRDRTFLETILAVIGPVVIHHDRDFRRRRGRRKKLVEIEQPLRPIPVHEWQRKKYPDEWFRYFRYELVLTQNRHWQPYWIFTQPSLYELKIARNWLWYFYEVDPAIETRLSELERWLEAHQGWQRYGWLKGIPQHNRWKIEDTAKHRELEREHRRDIAHAYKQFPEVEPAVPTQRGRLSFWRIFSNFSRRSPMQRQRAQTSSSAGASCGSCRLAVCAPRLGRIGASAPRVQSRLPLLNPKL